MIFWHRHFVNYTEHRMRHLSRNPYTMSADNPFLRHRGRERSLDRMSYTMYA